MNGDLISRSAFIEFIRNLPKTENGYSREYDESDIIHYINEQPTITEAEIRASVIDEALKALSIFNDREHGNEHFIYGIETAKEILEQLKERE